MRPRLAVLLTFACVLAVAAPAFAETTLFTTARQTSLSAGSGVLLYSAWDDQAEVYRLMQRTGGLSTAVSVAPSPRPFQADVGPTTSGHAFYVYSRCTDAEGSCDLYVFNPKTQVEQRSRASDPKHDDILPTYWKGRLAFVRDYGIRDKPKQIVYNRPNGSTSRSQRLPGLPSKRCDKGACINPQGSFEAMELYGDKLAQVVMSEDADTFPTSFKDKTPKAFPRAGIELRLVDRGLRRSRRLARSGLGEGAQGFSGVAFDRGRLYAGFTCLAGSCGSLAAGIYRYAYADDRWALAKEYTQSYGLAADHGVITRERNNSGPGINASCFDPPDDQPVCKTVQVKDPGFRSIPAP